MRRKIDLREYEESPALALSVDERHALARRDLGLAIAPVDGTADEYTLIPSSVVGAVEMGGLSVRIAPKIGVRQLLSLACYATGKIKLQASEFDFPRHSALPDALALAFGAAARRAFSRGLLHGYRTEEDALPAVRGRIRFDDQIRRRFGIPLPVEMRYDEFTADILLNRLVRAAAYRLGRLGLRSREARRRIAWVAESLSEVSLAAFPRGAVPEVRFDRLSEHYRGVVTLARLVLRHGAFEADLVDGDGGEKQDRSRVSVLGRPIPERRPEAVRHRRDLVVLEHLRQRRHRDRLAARHREHQSIALVERPRRVENLQRSHAQWNPVLPLRLHPLGDRPHLLGRVHLGPGRQAHFRRACRRQHQKLARQLDRSLRRPRRPHHRDRRRHLLVRQRPMVRHDVLLQAEHRQHPVARIVVAQVQRDRPVQHRADALAHGARRLRLAVPDRCEDLQHVGRVDLGDRPAADAREGVALDAAHPVLRVPPAAPATLLLLEYLPGGVGEGGHLPHAALLVPRVGARAGKPAVGQRQLARLGEGNQRRGAEAELAAAAADDEPLDPASSSAGLNEQVQAVAVGVASWRGRADEGGRERLVRMASSALGHSGRANTNRLFPALGRSSGVSGRNRFDVPEVPLLAATYWRPSTA